VILLAAAVYRPWRSTSLPLTDFGSFLPLIDHSQSIFEQIGAVTRYYISEGRFCILQYTVVVLAANAFGVDAAGWYWLYFALNALVIAAGWLVMRRTGLSRAATVLALSFWTTMSATPEIWIRPTGEPIALFFFLVALYFAVNYTEAPDWRRRAIIIAACSIGIIFAKEMLVVLLPAGWLVSRLRVNDGVWTWAPWTRKDTWLLVVVTAAVAIAMIAIGYVALTAPAGNYAAKFGEATGPLDLVLERLEIVLIPTAPALARLKRVANDPAWILLLALPALIWIRMVVGGIWTGGRRIAPILIVSAVWVSLGIASYVPWPGGDAFYMVPFAFGAMFGAAYALEAMMSGNKWAKPAVLAVSGLLICIASVESHTVTERYRLRARLNGDLVRNISAGDAPRVLVGAVRERPEQERWGWAWNLAGFVRYAAGTRVPQSRDLTCEEARTALERTPGMVVISRERGCGKLSESSVAMDEMTYRSAWPYLWEKHEVRDRVWVTRSVGSPSRSTVTDGLSAVRPVETTL
jgi:hypothetical protein